MKKNRPGTLLTLLVETKYQKNVENFLLLNTTTFGVRAYQSQRNILHREFIQLSEGNYNFRIKIGKLNNETIKITPEYEDLKAIATSENEPIRNVYEKAYIIIEKFKESIESEE